MDKPAPIIVRRVRKVAGRHHGGAWKVAYADFVTAMMAFFLVMWLVGIASKEQKAAVSEYFNNPSAAEGRAIVPGGGVLGPGGASDKLVPTANALSIPGGVGPRPGDPGDARARRPQAPDAIARAAAQVEDRRRMEELRHELEAAIENSQALAPFKDQLLIDLTPEGLRIQIVDRMNRPMFDLGSSSMKDYTVEVMHELGRLLVDSPYRIALAGHTDETPFHAPRGYGNWELSSDRANAARRALLAGGLAEARVARVVGLASSVPFDQADPRAPINRRISIVVLNRATDLQADALASPGATGNAIDPVARAAPSHSATAAAPARGSLASRAAALR
ncbi:motility protein MotB [Pseudoxanthomonas broegbernensis]|uniref:Motility protein MotB n=1 Tax=Pseudoxanthomonas broegbernensis TaxID=83619 RepID=A0A7V8GL43_9GAMM|nr:flagellar motor protein MotB [Pseudoxanthomonas broegbernensis]KAF1685548.1 motility protein MotB [Pseudoxanthomonas broegbernensis]MBB6065918.1 chemotaxis protein MotB [Pseudoxanthomonas broegbernensis]